AGRSRGSAGREKNRQGKDNVGVDVVNWGKDLNLLHIVFATGGTSTLLRLDRDVPYRLECSSCEQKYK
ncbi:MAG TPA: hypothetical protein VH164_18240, partial [Ktedonobacteraceae bacterium]|nr:hypothetical protein [Ktedonobacteraceae bacterium]